jgi:aryl-alcohol dehydrogenase-like predicted oxidoreductase
MKSRKLGDSNLEVPVIALGCMSRRYGYGPATEKQPAMTGRASV